MPGFLCWVSYFRSARGNAERQVQDAAAGRNLRLWAFGHIPLRLGIASLGADTSCLARRTTPGGVAPWVFSSGVAPAMLGATLVSLATNRRPIASGWPFLLIALAGAVSPALMATAPVLVACPVGFACCQIAVSMFLDRSPRRT